MTTTTPLQRCRNWICHEVHAGIVLLSAALVAIVWANSPWRGAYAELVAAEVGPASLGLHLSLGHWAADGLLAVFFFVVGVELKHELRVGSLSRPKEAAVPMVAAVGGMAVPAAFYVGVITLAGDNAQLVGWAIPTATDIAFALAVLAVFGRGLPTALRTFLLTLAVVDDLLAITIIAAFYTATIQIWALAVAALAIVAFALVVRSRWARWWLLLPLGLFAWWCMHESGVHATVAGVLLGLSVTATPRHGEGESRTERYKHLVEPLSYGVALPIFAFFSAGVTIVDDGIAEVFGSPVALGVLAGLVCGKILGVTVTTFLVTRFTPFEAPGGIGVRDLVGVGFLTGIGFTVALLVAELSFPDGTERASAKGAILLASAVTAAMGAVALRLQVARSNRAPDPAASRQG